MSLDEKLAVLVTGVNSFALRYDSKFEDWHASIDTGRLGAFKASGETAEEAVDALRQSVREASLKLLALSSDGT